jgi:hypothetical protein
MTVVDFPSQYQPAPREWQSHELQRLRNACSAYLPRGHAVEWAVGATERGDPQLYLIGPAPDYDCILSISRLGRLYILEDGNGRIVFEDPQLLSFAEQVADTLRRKKQAIIAQIAVTWCAMREFYEEKIEPALAEPVEILSHFAPQMASLA